MSSQDFDSALTGIQNGIGDIIKSYANEYIKAATEAIDLSKKFVQWAGDFQSDPTEEIPRDDLASVLQEACDISTSLTSNPVMQRLMQEVKEEYGISIDSPMALAQNVMQGKDSGLLRVIVTLINFPGRCRAYHKAAETLYTTLFDLHRYIVHNGLDGSFTDRVDIPEGVILKLQAAKNNLQSCLVSPFRLDIYEFNKQEVMDVVELLESTDVVGSSSDNLQSMALKIFMDSVRTEVKSSYQFITKLQTECKTLLNVILTTDTSSRIANTKRFQMAKSAVRRINEVLTQMKAGGTSQVVMIPKYVLALNTAYYILKTGTPASDPDYIGPLDVSGIKVTSATIDQISDKCRRLFRFMQFPRSLDSLPGELESFKTTLDQFMTQIEQTEAHIQALSGTPERYKAFEIAQSVLLLIEGLDLAQEFLVGGKYDEFFSLTDSTATSEGAMINALDTLADLTDQVGLGAFSEKIREKSTTMKKQQRNKAAKKEAKKEKKQSKVVKQIEDLNQMVEKTIELGALIVGTVEAITSASN